MSAGTSPSHADAWVRHLGRDTRAQYKAQAADGSMFLMKCGGDRASSIRWFIADDVTFIRPVTVVEKEPSQAVRNRLERLRDRTAEADPAEADA